MKRKITSRITPGVSYLFSVVKNKATWNLFKRKGRKSVTAKEDIVNRIIKNARNVFKKRGLTSGKTEQFLLLLHEVAANIYDHAFFEGYIEITFSRHCWIYVIDDNNQDEYDYQKLLEKAQKKSATRGLTRIDRIGRKLPGTFSVTDDTGIVFLGVVNTSIYRREGK